MTTKNINTLFSNNVRSGNNPVLHFNPSTNKIEPTDDFKHRIQKILDRDKYKNIPYLTQEGLFTIRVIKKQKLETKDGMQLIFSLVNDQALARDTEAAGTAVPNIYKAGIFYEGFSPDSDIELITELLQPDTIATIRMSKNFRGNKYYIRYLSFDSYEAGNREEPV